jgi:hypothetical protein
VLIAQLIALAAVAAGLFGVLFALTLILTDKDGAL